MAYNWLRDEGGSMVRQLGCGSRERLATSNAVAQPCPRIRGVPRFPTKSSPQTNPPQLSLFAVPFPRIADFWRSFSPSVSSVCSCSSPLVATRRTVAKSLVFYWPCPPAPEQAFVPSVPSGFLGSFSEGGNPQFESNPVKPGQSVSQSKSPAQVPRHPRHILRVPSHNTQPMVVGNCGGYHRRQAIRNPQCAIRNPSQTPSPRPFPIRPNSGQ